jgi:hypothetical protein
MNKAFKAFKQGKLFEMKQQGHSIVVTIYDPKSPNIEQALSGKTLVLGPGSIVLWDKLVKELEAAE